MNDNLKGERLTSEKKSLYGILAAVAVFVLTLVLIPDAEGLTVEGKRAVALLLGMLVLLVTEALPMSITSILTLLMLYFLKIMEYDAIWSACGHYIFFFVLSMFGLCAAITKTRLPQRMVGLILKWAKTNPKKIVLGFVAATTLLSSIMSNITTCIIFVGLALVLMKANGDPKPGSSNLGKALFLGIPAASIVGGIAALPGNAMNMVALSFIESTLGYNITFLQWSVVGFPVAIIMIFVISWWLVTVFKPEQISEESYNALMKETTDLGKFSVMEIKVTVIFGIMIICWILSSWITVINTNIVALLGLIVMFLPGIRILEGDDLTKNAGWEGLILLVTLIAFMEGFSATGVADWFISRFLNGAENWSRLKALFVISFIPCIVHILVPSGPAVLTVTMVPLLALGSACGIHPLITAFIVATWTGVSFMLPVEAIYLLSYGYGYYDMKDTMKAGVVPTIAMLALTVLLVPVLVGALGLA